MIYVDHAATSYNKPEEVAKAVYEAVLKSGNPGRSACGASLDTAREVFVARRAVNQFFDGYGVSNVAFSSGITESLNTALKGLLSPGDHVITTWAEHNSVLRPLYEMEEKGVQLSITDPYPASILKNVTKNTKMVVMMHGSNVTGEVYPIEEVGQFCQENHILFVVDCAQTAGIFPISMKKEGIDVLCFAGHKGLMGPQGIGGLCIKKGLEVHPLISGGTGVHSFLKEQPKEMPTALEAGTLNVPGIMGLKAGLQWIEKNGIDRIREKEQYLLKLFYEKIKDIPGITLYGSFEDLSKHTAVISLNIAKKDASVVSDLLWEKAEIVTRAGVHCAPLMHEHYKTEDVGMVRFSFGYHNTEQEVQICADILKMIAEERIV